MKKLNGEIKLSGVKLSLNVNIGEVSFKEESTRKSQDMKRNFSHRKVNDIKISLDEEVNEITFTMDALNDMIKQAAEEVIEVAKENAKPVEENKEYDIKLSFCEDYLRGNRKPQSDEEYRMLLNVYFNYSIEELDNLQHSPEALLRRECKKYLVKRIENLK